MLVSTTTAKPLPIRCPQCSELSARAVVTVEGNPSDGTVDSVDGAGAATELAILGDVRAISITSLHCDACGCDWLPGAEPPSALQGGDEPLVESFVDHRQALREDRGCDTHPADTGLASRGQ